MSVVEVLEVRVVVRVIDLHERHARFEQAAGKQAVLAELVPAIAIVIGGGLLGHVEHFATSLKQSPSSSIPSRRCSRPKKRTGLKR